MYLQYSHCKFWQHILYCYFCQCLVEAIYILDTLCSTDKSLIPKLIEIIRRLYARVTSDINKWKRVLIPVVQFFLNHGECCKPDNGKLKQQ